MPRGSEPAISVLRRTGAALAAAGTLALIGCSASGPVPSAPAVVTFEVADQERFSVELIDEDLVQHVVDLMNGGEDGRIPTGRIVRNGDGGVNAPWTWHLDPSTLEFADFTTEVCDGLPSYVEDRTLTSDTYCPWIAEVVALEPLDG